MESIQKLVYEHLVKVKEDSSTPLYDLLLQRIDETVAKNMSEQDRTQLLGAAQELLPTLQQDASPVTSLVVRLIEPETVKFEQVDAFLNQNSLLSHNGTSDDQYLKGLESQNKDVNILVLNLLHKARRSPSGIGLVASKANVVQAMIRAWLTSPETAVAEKAAKVLKDFLLAGEDPEHATIEKNLMVRRVFHDRDIYESLFSLCSLKTVGEEGQPSKNHKTIAQARLLDLLVAIDHSSSPIRISQFPDIERRYDVTDSTQGILYYAFVKMMNIKDDDLLLSTFIRLCARYMVKRGPFGTEQSSYSLTFLKGNQLHQTCLSYFMEPISDHGFWLLTDSAMYLTWYCEQREDDLLKDEDLCIQIANRLSRRFKNASKAEWHSNDALRLELLVLGALPRILHLPGSICSHDGLPPLFDVPANTANPHVLMHLKRIFCERRSRHEPSSGAMTTEHRADRMIARVLYLQYYERNLNFWSNLIDLAETEALASPALAAIAFMHAFANADWEQVDQSVVASLPSEEELERMRGGLPAPVLGLEGMLLEGGVAETVLPYFLSPFRTSPVNRQVRRTIPSGKDPASTVARARIQLTIHVRDLLKREDSIPELEDILEIFNRQVEKNSREVAAAAAQGAADSVATMRR